MINVCLMCACVTLHTYSRRGPVYADSSLISLKSCQVHAHNAHYAASHLAMCNASLQTLCMHIESQPQHTLTRDSDLAFFRLSVHEAV